MIPASHITFDGDTAWWVIEPDDIDKEYLDRLCDTCGGEGDLDGTHDCPDCIDGRHVFDIEVESLCMQEGRHELVNGSCHFCGSSGSLSLSVSVVDVLGPIDLVSPGVWTVRANVHVGTMVSPLPSAAAPGMHAVRLAVLG